MSFTKTANTHRWFNKNPRDASSIAHALPHGADSSNHLDVYQLVRSIDIDTINNSDNEGKTLLHHLVEDRYSAEFIQQFISECHKHQSVGMDCYPKDNEGYTPLDYASRDQQEGLSDWLQQFCGDFRNRVRPFV